MADEEAVDWQAQYEEALEKLNQLETTSKDAQKQYDDLLEKHKTVEKQNEELHNKLHSQKDQLNEVNKLIEPALEEYNKLQNKYEIEKGCRHEAETYASQIVRQNKKLKRQSMDLIAVMNKSSTPLHLMNINLEEDDSEDKKLENGYQESLNKTLRELKNEVAQLKASLSKSQDELQVEKDNYKWASEMYKSVKTQLQQTETSLKQHKEAMKELSTVSEAAYDEYENLKERYELEIKRRSVFEKKIEEVAVQNNKMKRQSEVLLMKLTPGDQLHKALMEIEDLTEKLNEQRKYYDAEISKLESKVQEHTDNKVLRESMESERLVLETEKDDLIKRVKDYEEKYAKLEEEYDALLKKYEDSKCPPPPPPPPPPPAITASKGFLSRIVRKKKGDRAKLKVAGANVNTDFNKALDEMMENIKKGKSLRPTLKPVKRGSGDAGSGDFRMILKSKSLDDVERQDTPQSPGSESDNSAMSELHNIMSKMKRTHSESDLLSPIESEHGESELARTFRRVKKSHSVDPVPDVQRRNKLSLVTEERESEVLAEDDVFSNS
ncbi:shootin-1-like isoform X2 [Mercenaria mercenaria]|uniref:shootin-1-like isoform X2 n=1 Tax=Mercenaria mercenaria TaxID=6596 RepID=UPI00234F976A|nr:shootin-1-like isoform X2 [Mercenaria mercenaria]